MKYRQFGRLKWEISEVGYGMWGMGGEWKGGTDEEAIEGLRLAAEMGCNFFDTAWIYGSGHSESLFKKALAERHNLKEKSKKIYVATKVPPKNFKWPGVATDPIIETYPSAHIIDYCNKSLDNLGTEYIDLLQLHVWDDSWAKSDEWKMAVEILKKQGLIKGFGISVNKWESSNILEAIKTGLIDSIQVVYNIFEQAPEDGLFPECKARDIAVIARVPFDEGSLTGSYKRDTVFERGDWRAKFYTPEMLNHSIDRLEKIKEVVPSGMALSQLALRFILQNEVISTVIPGMRRITHVEENLAVSDGIKLNSELYKKLKTFRWDRNPLVFKA